MRIPLAVSLFALGCAPLFAQAPPPNQGAPKSGPPPARASNSAAAGIAKVQNSEVGFAYSLPADWEFVAPPPVPKVLVPYPTAVAPRKGDACVEVAMTARHGISASVVVILKLPFDCYGQSMTANDLANFGMGAAAGINESFTILSQAQGAYSLGGHSVWIERADGTPKQRPENPFTFEIACTVLKKGAVCWLTMAEDAESLREFERQAVTLEGKTFDALVPEASVPTVPPIAGKKSP